MVQTWTVTSSCVSPIECTGEVTSDQGWTAPLRLDDYWFVDRDIAQLGAVSRRHLRHRPPDVLFWGINPATERTGLKITELHGGPRHHEDRQRRVRRQQAARHRAARVDGKAVLTVARSGRQQVLPRLGGRSGSQVRLLLQLTVGRQVVARPRVVMRDRDRRSARTVAAERTRRGGHGTVDAGAASTRWRYRRPVERVARRRRRRKRSLNRRGRRRTRQSVHRAEAAPGGVPAGTAPAAAVCPPPARRSGR